MENKDLDKQNELLLEEDELEEYLKKTKNWKFSADKKKIFRNLNFKTLRETVDFINEVATFSGKIKHYPDVMIIRRFIEVTVELTTPKIRGLSKKDFILAAEIDAIAGWKIRMEQWLASPKVLAVILIIFLLIMWLLSTR